MELLKKDKHISTGDILPSLDMQDSPERIVKIINALIDKSNRIIDILNSLANITGSITQEIGAMKKRKEMVRNRLMANMNKLAMTDDHPLAKILKTIKNKKEK